MGRGRCCAILPSVPSASSVVLRRPIPVLTSGKTSALGRKLQEQVNRVGVERGGVTGLPGLRRQDVRDVTGMRVHDVTVSLPEQGHDWVRGTVGDHGVATAEEADERQGGLVEDGAQGQWLSAVGSGELAVGPDALGEQAGGEANEVEGQGEPACALGGDPVRAGQVPALTLGEVLHGANLRVVRLVPARGDVREGRLVEGGAQPEVEGHSHAIAGDVTAADELRDGEGQVHEGLGHQRGELGEDLALSAVEGGDEGGGGAHSLACLAGLGGHEREGLHAVPAISFEDHLSVLVVLEGDGGHGVHGVDEAFEGEAGVVDLVAVPAKLDGIDG
ncbi:MAG: hypothetical protein CVV42_21505, partial [Candidatus Riflebacteria bacterium HGW-Riflebacteria-2]